LKEIKNIKYKIKKISNGIKTERGRLPRVCLSVGFCPIQAITLLGRELCSLRLDAVAIPFILALFWTERWISPLYSLDHAPRDERCILRRDTVAMPFFLALFWTERWISPLYSLDHAPTGTNDAFCVVIPSLCRSF